MYSSEPPLRFVRTNYKRERERERERQRDRETETETDRQSYIFSACDCKINKSKISFWSRISICAKYFVNCAAISDHAYSFGIGNARRQNTAD